MTITTLTANVSAAGEHARARAFGRASPKANVRRLGEPGFGRPTPRCAPLHVLAESTNSGAKEKASKGSLSYQHLMVTLFDSNPNLTGGSRQALSTACDLASLHSSKVTVVVVDDANTSSEIEHTAAKLTTINGFLQDRGCIDFSVVEKLTTENHSALVGDVADDLDADMVVISSDSVHAHSVDANLLAEFVPCSLLLLP